MIENTVVKFTLPAGRYVIFDPAMLYVDLNLYYSDIYDRKNNNSNLLSADGVITEEDHVRVFGDWYSILGQLERTNHGIVGVEKEVWATKTKLAYEYGINTHYADGYYLCLRSYPVQKKKIDFSDFFVSSGWIGITTKDIYDNNMSDYNREDWRAGSRQKITYKEDFDISFNKDTGLITIGDYVTIPTDPVAHSECLRIMISEKKNN